MTRMDETNLQILHLLQKNARTTITDLALAVGRSESTVRERVTALEIGGYLAGYEARVDWDIAGLPALAMIQARCDVSRIDAVAKQLAAIPNVTRALLMTGSKPVVVLMRVRDMSHLQSILTQHIGPGDLTDVDIQIALQSLVERRPPVLLDAGIAPAEDASGGAKNGAPIKA